MVIVLSPFEQASISWICNGKSVTEIARLEGKSIPEIERYLDRARIALGAVTLSEAVLAFCRMSQTSESD
jgi:DNA-binding CsgD family transcriptional regulator